MAVLLISKTRVDQPVLAYISPVSHIQIAVRDQNRIKTHHYNHQEFWVDLAALLIEIAPLD
jgi:hypothetical protein